MRPHARGAVLLILAWVASCGAPERQGTIAAIGALVPLSGPGAATGAQIVEGMKLAAATGGLPLEILPRDTQGSPGSAVRRLGELAAEDRVLALAGGWHAATARPLAAAASRQRLPFVALSPLTVPDSSGSRSMAVLHRVAALGRAGAIFAREDLGAATAGIARRSGADACDVLAASFRREFETRGGTITWVLEAGDDGRLPPPPEGPAVHAVWVIGGGPTAVHTAELGDPVRDAALLVPEGWGGEGLEALASSGRPVRIVTYFAPGDTGSAAREYVGACEAAGTTPTAAGALGWDAVRAVRAAAGAETATREGVAAALARSMSLDGATGRLDLGAGSDSPAVSAVTSEGARFLRRVPVPESRGGGGAAEPRGA